MPNWSWERILSIKFKGTVAVASPRTRSPTSMVMTSTMVFVDSPASRTEFLQAPIPPKASSSLCQRVSRPKSLSLTSMYISSLVYHYWHEWELLGPDHWSWYQSVSRYSLRHVPEIWEISTQLTLTCPIFRSVLPQPVSANIYLIDASLKFLANVSELGLSTSMGISQWSRKLSWAGERGVGFS